MKKMNWLAVLLWISVTSVAYGQTSIQMNAGKTKVIVTKGTGYINFYAVDDDIRLSFDSKSFFTLRVGSKFYTNNDSPPPGMSELDFDTIYRIGDTLTAVAQMDSCRVLQIVQPRQTQLGVRVGVRYVIENLSTTPVEIQAQYLLDAQIGAKDGLKVLGPIDGLNREWKVYSQTIPSHLALAGALTDLQNNEILSLLTLEDSLFRIDRPSMVMVAHWPTVERMRFIDPNMQLPDESVMDMAIALQWQAQTFGAGEIREIAAFAYGSPEYLYCAPTLSFVPAKITIPETTDQPVFTIPSYVVNMGTSTLLPFTVSMSTSGSVTFENGTNTMQRGIPAVAAMEVHPFNTRIKHDGAGTSGSLSFGSDCLSSIAFEQAFEDVLAPRIISLHQSPQPDCLLRRDTIVITDSTSKDIGIESIDVDATNFEYNFLTTQTYRSPLERIAISVKDTMFDATATITATDGHSNVTTYIASYCTTADKLAPEVRVGTLKNGVWLITVIENRAWDRKIDTIRITGQTNTTIDLQSGYQGSDSLTFAVLITDTTSNSSFCIQAWDLAGNAANLSCFDYKAPLEVGTDVAFRELQLWPNPTATRLNVARPGEEKPVMATIYNVRGERQWQGVFVGSSQSIDVSQLPAGAYTLSTGDGVSSPFTIVR